MMPSLTDDPAQEAAGRRRDAHRCVETIDRARALMSAIRGTVGGDLSQVRSRLRRFCEG